MKGTLSQSCDLVNHTGLGMVSCGIADQNGDGFAELTNGGYQRGFNRAAENLPAGPLTLSSVTFKVTLNTFDQIPVDVNVYLDLDGIGTGADAPGVDAPLVRARRSTWA